MYGRHSHLGLAAEKIDAQIFRRSSLPPSPPRLHLCEGGDGDYTECSICAGETAEGLLQIHVMVNESSICPNDKSCSKGRARGHQVRVISCNCCCHPSRGATHLQQRWKDGGRRRLGAAKILSLQFSGDFPSTPLRTSRTAKLLAMFWPSAPAATCSCYAFLSLHLQVPTLLKNLSGPINRNSTNLPRKYTWNTHFTLKHRVGIPCLFFFLAFSASAAVSHGPCHPRPLHHLLGIESLKQRGFLLQIVLCRFLYYTGSCEPVRGACIALSCTRLRGRLLSAHFKPQTLMAA